jgi:MobA-like NTP transferase protein
VPTSAARNHHSLFAARVFQHHRPQADISVRIRTPLHNLKMPCWPLPVSFISNPDYRTGLASSLKAGIAVLPETAAGALILLADMPCVSVSLIVMMEQPLKRRRCAEQGHVYFLPHIFSGGLEEGRAPRSPSRRFMASNKSLPISAGLPRKPARTGTTASGARADSSKAWIRRSVKGRSSRLPRSSAPSRSPPTIPASRGF